MLFKQRHEVNLAFDAKLAIGDVLIELEILGEKTFAVVISCRVVLLRLSLNLRGKDLHSGNIL